MADRRSSATSLQSSLSSSTSHRSEEVAPPHNDWTSCSGPVLFTGPSGLRDQRVAVQSTDFQSVGIGARSREMTHQLSFLSRAAPGTPFPKGKHYQVGEIGWEVRNLKPLK